LTSKQNAVTLGDLAQRTFDDYYQICQQIVEFFGRDTPVHHLTPEDFRAYRARVAAGGFGRTQKRKKQLSAVSLKNEVNRARVVFNYGFKSQLLSQPAAYGLEFSRPAKHLLRRARGVSGQRYCDAIELRSLLNAATIPLKAMLLLGVNCGLGNREVGMLRFTNLDLKKGWLSYPRNKTGIDRRAKLWPETIAAIKEAIAARRAPVNEDHKELVFITRTGAPWFKESSDSPIAKEFSKLAKTLDVNRPGLSFYSLRHTTETIGGGCRDQVAVNFVMGHAPSESDMSANYRHDIEDSRLEAVAEHIHRWLLPDEDIDATGDG
jgi:integrase